MKLKHLFISLLAAAATLAACNKEEEPLGAPAISFEQGTMEFEKAGGENTLVITCTRDWTASCAESWVGLSKVSGKGSTKTQTIEVSVDPNDSYDRTASISFVAGDNLVTKNVIISQAGSGPAPVTGVFYSQAFKTDGQGDWTINDVTKPDALSAVWTYNSSYGMVATAYDKSSSKNYDSESWLISPEIDLSVVQSAHLQLTHAANYFSSSTFKTDITLWIQADGEDGFTQLTIPTYPSNSDFTYVESGDIDLQNYVGKTVRIGIKYLSSSTKAGTYEVSDVKMSTEPFQTVEPEIPDEGTGTGTAGDPYDVVKALAIVNAGAASSDNVYVKGIISQVKEIDTSYGNATYFISNDGKTSKELEIYRGYYLSGAKFTSSDQIKAGDEVVVYGKLTLYSSTAEMTQGNQLYSINGEGGTDPTTPDTPEGTVVYSNNFDKEEATKSYGTSSSSWPYLDQFEGWKNESGTGASTVEYTYKNVSVRANSVSSGTYSNYSGSGSNNIFFGSAGCYLNIQKITLAEGRNYVLTFGSEKYLSSGDSNFSTTEFMAYVSVDGEKWLPLTYTIGSTDISGKWNLNTSETFTLGASDKELYIYFSASVASAYRLDDVTLTAVEEAGTELDFSNGVDLGTGSSTPAVAMTIAQIITSSDNTSVSSNEVYVAAVTTKGYVALEDGKAVYVYGGAAPSCKVGDKVTFTGTKTTYYGLPEITSPTTTVVSSGNTVPYPEAKDITDTFDAYSATEAEYITFVATVVKDGSYTNFKISDNNTMVGTLSNAPSTVSFTEGEKVRIYGFFNTLNTSKNLVNVIYVSSSAVSEEDPGQGDDSVDATVSVEGAVVTLTLPGSVAAREAVSADLNAQDYSNMKAATDITLADGTVISFSKGNGTAAPTYVSAYKAVMVSSKGVVTVTGSKNIAKVVLNCTGESYVGNTDLSGSVADKVWTITNGGDNTGTAKLRISTIDIYYVAE